MKSISIDNEKYVKATDIARELGYTADYVGQLCRAGKVDAQLVGRSWYVSEDSLKGHKKTRYRSTKQANKKTIATSLEAKDMDAKESFSVAVHVGPENKSLGYGNQQFYSRTPKVPEHEYFSDESDLIPRGKEIEKKTGRLSVTLADAQKIKIKSSSTEYDFNPTKREEIRFAGSLSISEVEDIDPEDEKIDENKDILVEPMEKASSKHVVAKNAQDTVHQKSVDKKEPHDNATHIKIRHLRKTTKKKKRNGTPEHNINGVMSMRRDRISARNPSGGTLMINVPSNNYVGAGSGAYMLVISAMVSVCIAVVLVGLESIITVENDVMTTAYFFHFDTLLATVYEAF